MTSRRTSRRMLFLVAFGCVLFACGDRLIRDPSFELWCGGKLCKPWESHGEVTRVGTWHKRDYGVSLGDGAEISQRVEHAPVKCIELELIADVVASAEVQLELDFMDDGTVEHSEPIAESHWARLHFLIAAPTWYDGLRFTVRKQGHGRAVIAQLSATSNSDCEGEPIALDHRPDGGHCNADEQCESGVCDLIPQRTMLEGFPPPNNFNVCSGCRGDEDCGEGKACGVLESKWGLYRDCVDSGAAEVGAFCEDEAVCASGRCSHGLPFNNMTCAECERDSDCADGELCGLEVLDGGAARVCEEQSALPLGALCGENAQCDSGVCCFGACSECCGEWVPCEDAQCGTSQVGGASATQLCGFGMHQRAAGEPCGTNLDCASGSCNLPEVECMFEAPEVTIDDFAQLCPIQQQIAGTCR